MASSGSNWWRAPAYFSVSVLLAFLAISTGLHLPSTDQTPSSTSSVTHQLSLNASRALRRSGFNILATLIQISPDLFFSSPNSTIFAIQDSAITNASLPPSLLKSLLRYHTSPSKLPIDALLNHPQGKCLKTLIHQKNIAITKIDRINRSVEINHVLISHPNIFLAGPISIHGVIGPFLSLDTRLGFDFIQAPVCNSNFILVSELSKSKRLIEWTEIVRMLSSNGFISFAVGLHSVLERILEDFSNLHSFTILCPPDMSFVASPLPMLYRTVRFHILPQRFTYSELAALPSRSFLRTLLPDRVIKISGANSNLTELIVNGVNITLPDIFASKRFVVHGISRAFEIAESSYTS